MDAKSIPCTDQSALASRGVFYVGGEFVTENGKTRAHGQMFVENTCQRA